MIYLITTQLSTLGSIVISNPSRLRMVDHKFTEISNTSEIREMYRIKTHFVLERKGQNKENLIHVCELPS